MPDNKRRPCKIGTIPMVVEVHGVDARKLKVGEVIRVRPVGWQTVVVTRVDEDGYFMADAN